MQAAEKPSFHWIQVWRGSYLRRNSSDVLQIRFPVISFLQGGAARRFEQAAQHTYMVLRRRWAPAGKQLAFFNVHIKPDYRHQFTEYL
jgi:hypothetical protein